MHPTSFPGLSPTRPYGARERERERERALSCSVGTGRRNPGERGWNASLFSRLSTPFIRVAPIARARICFFFRNRWFGYELKLWNCTKISFTVFKYSLRVNKKNILGEYSSFFKPSTWNYLHLDWINSYRNDFVSKRLATRDGCFSRLQGNQVGRFDISDLGHTSLPSHTKLLTRLFACF